VTSTEAPQSTADEGGNRLAPYFPRLAIEWMATDPGTRHRDLEGTIAFVDISGFTKLSEGLALHGKVGAEELTATIGTCFVALLDVAVAYGGRLLKFGGDAQLLYFSGEAHAARACRAALEMRRALRSVGRLTVLGQKVQLRMSVGIHSGLFHFFLVGESHRELVVAGPAATATVTMEATADAGEIVISDATASALRPGVVGAAKGTGHLLVRAPTVPADSFLPFERVDPDLDLLHGIPTGLREVLTGTHQESEHRRVTVAFVHFDGTDGLIERVGPAETADQLDRLVSHVQRAVERQEVTFLATDADRDGGKIILTAGAPSTSGDDEHHMLLAVREIMDAHGPLPIRIGVNRGAVFVGEVGPPYRRTFTVMGDAVNLAARLMAKAAPGQILITPEILTRSRTGFVTEELEPFTVKGKSEPVRALSVGALTGSRRVGGGRDLALVGRVRERRILEQAIEEVREGTGSLVEIVGEPGAGKSRLVAWLRSAADDMVQLSTVCERYDASTPYYVVGRLLRTLIGLPPEGNGVEVAAAFLTHLEERAPAVLTRAPLIATALGLTVPETAETRDIDEGFRRARMAEAVIDLLGELLPDSGLLTVEDAHFMDEASADLFGYLAALVGPSSWLICVTRRDGASAFAAPEEHATRIALGPLEVGDATELAHLATADAPIPQHRIDALVARSAGNPLFLLDLLAVATERDALDELPDSVERVVTARIDRLSPDDRRLLRRISVLGQSFPYELLRDVLDNAPGEFDPAWERLDEFVLHDGLGELSFRSALLRDCAYDGLTFRLRRALHARAGDTIRDAALDRGKDQPELLSFHYLHAQRYDEAWSYSLIAAERAKTAYANVEVAEFYERALLAGRRLPELERAELAAVHEALGDARNSTGGYQGAAAAYRAARRLLGGDTVGQARVALKLAQVQGWLESYSNALRWITRGLRLLEGEDGAAALRQRAELLSWYGRFCQEEGHHNRAIAWCTRAVGDAEAAGDREVLAESLRTIDWARLELGQLEEPVNLERALTLFEETGNLTGQGTTLNGLGIVAYFRGEWDRAAELYERSRIIDRRTGNAVSDAFNVFNIGEIYLDQGRLDLADEHMQAVSRTWRAAGYRSGVAAVKGKQARVATGRGRSDEALRLFGEAIDEFRAIGSHAEAFEEQARTAECLAASGDHVAALATAAEALTIARGLGGVPPQISLLQRVRGAALARFGRTDEARSAFEAGMAAARKRHSACEAALTQLTMADTGILPAGVGADDLRAEAWGTLSAQGMVLTPDLTGATSGLVVSP
jgi:class 3 adenylate cyclase/tetratricopeptide (TPR) repeat protein